MSLDIYSHVLPLQEASEKTLVELIRTRTKTRK
jgi:hypothetical protein